MWVKWGVSILWVLLTFEGLGQFSEDTIIRKIRSFQIRQDPFYDSGLFPSQRSWSFFHPTVADNTLFFTVSIVSTLKMNEELMSDQSRMLSRQIASVVGPLYEKYKNRNGGSTYNFWQTAPPDLPFPNAGGLISNKRGRLPDDYNTTVLALLSQEKSDRIDELIRQKMNSYSERSIRDDVRLMTPDKYASSRAYEVWFGKNMPQTFDLCVMSNVMLYVLSREFELTGYDSATVALINQMILDKDYLHQTKAIAHHTSSPAIILYHVARVLAIDSQGLFASIRQPVIDEIKKLLTKAGNEVEKTLLRSSLLRLGQQLTRTTNFGKFGRDLKDFSFFTVNPSTISTGKTRLLPAITWKCEAYGWALALEYVLLEKARLSN